MDESFQDRQQNEKSSLTAIYGDQINIINSDTDLWEPTECVLYLTSQQSEVVQKPQNAPFVHLHVTCSAGYPDCIPEISIDAVKGLSKEKSGILLSELVELAKSLVGEVMIFELAQHAEKFIDQNTSPGFESFYEEMISRKRDQEQEELKKRIDDEEKNRELIMNEIYSKQQAVKKALKKHKNLSDFSDSSISNDFNHNIPEIYEESIQEDCHDEKENLLNSQVDRVEEWKMHLEDFSPWTISKHGQSRFAHEFEYIKWLGRGAFGDVIKVRNKLDDGFYAVKRIQLKAANKQLNKRITREVKLLSRLNHENVVRYYNSWIEVIDLPSNSSPSLESSPKKKSLGNAAASMLPRNEAFSHDWNVSTNSIDCGDDEDDDDDDSWISFKVDSNEGDHKSLSFDVVDNQESGIKSLTYMYIQMELCEKNTLRTAIDGCLYEDNNRVWRLFREITEGLCHIHQQGIIHRDLKPVNIFIGYGDRVKIGDFGLATTIIFQKQSAPRGEYSSVKENQNMDSCKGDDKISVPAPPVICDSSHTGHVGTALYVAPELESFESKVSYNEKVDIYSLGVIFFEMCHPPWRTKMEQILVISELRKKEPSFPESFPHKKDSPQYTLVRLMLNHNAKDRPTSHELLSSKFIPPPLLEEAEMKETISRTLSNPQSKDYKFLIASCFNQVTPAVIDATYDLSTGHSGRFILLLESATNIFRSIFLRHGAICLLPPLFTPYGKRADTAVCLMNRWGGIVYATHDLRLPFARYLTRNYHLTHFKRYAIDKVYRERRVLGLHPKEMYECAFDIVTPTPEDLMPECELVFVISEIMSEFPSLLSKNCSIRLNHSSIIQAILVHCGVEPKIQKFITTSIFKVKNEFDSRNEINLFKSLDLTDNIKSSLVNIMMIQGSLEEVKSQLLSIITETDLVTLCLQGFCQLQSLIMYCKTLDVQFDFSVSMGVVQNAHNYSGVMFQVVIDQKSKLKNIDKHILICGGRYDHLIKTCRQVQPVPNEASQCVAGFCLSMDKFLSCLSDYKKLAAFDVLICATGSSHITSDKLFIIRDLWKYGIRTSFTHSSQSLEELQDYCQEFGISHIVILKDSDTKGYARVRSWNKEKFNERKILLSELLDYLLKAVKNSLPDQAVKSEVKSGCTVENANITFISMEKLTITSKKRYEIQISNSLCSICEKFSSKAKIEIIGLFLEESALKMLGFCAEGNSPEQEINLLLKKYPRHRKYFLKVLDQLPSLRKTNNPPILILFSLVDNSFKLIL